MPRYASHTLTDLRLFRGTYEVISRKNTLKMASVNIKVAIQICMP